MAYSQQVLDLYRSIGKDPSLIDSQGGDFWTNALSTGAMTPQDFYASAGTTYKNMVDGASSPYASQNQQGFSNLRGQIAAGDSAAQSMLENAGLSPGQIGVFDNNHPNGVYPGPYNPNFGQSSGAGAPSLTAYTPSPYLGAMAQGLRDQFTGFMNDGLAANRGGDRMLGTVGGSRAGIAEARTMTDAGKGFDAALANLYGQDYQAQMGRNLQQYGMDQNFALGNKTADNSFFLGQGQLALGNKTADYNYNLGNQGQMLGFASDQRNQDRADSRLGMDMYSLGTQAPWLPLQNANGIYGNYTGFGNTTNNSNAGGGWQGALGGALAGASLGKQLGWWG